MVLMGILAVLSEDKVGRDSALQLFENILHPSPFKRHEAVPKLLQKGAPQAATREHSGGVLCFLHPNACGAEHHPMDQAPRILLGQAQDSSAATDFDIVGMTAEAENLRR